MSIWRTTTEEIEVHSPYSGEFVGRVREGRRRRGPPGARRRGGRGATPLPAHERAAILDRVAALLRERREEVGADRSAPRRASRSRRRGSRPRAPSRRTRSPRSKPARSPARSSRWTRRRPASARSASATRRSGSSGRSRLQLPAEPGRAQGRPRDRRRMPGRAQAGGHDAAVGPAAGRARAGRRTAGRAG